MDHLYLFQWQPIVWPDISADGGWGWVGRKESHSSCGLGALGDASAEGLPSNAGISEECAIPNVNNVAVNHRSDAITI